MRMVTVLVWVLAGLLLMVAVRSRHRYAAAHEARTDRDERRRARPMIDPYDPARAGPCWDGVAAELLRVGDDRWIGVGCDVEGGPRRGESPECTLLRKKITACLRHLHRLRLPAPVEREQRLKLHDDGGEKSVQQVEAADGWGRTPTS